MAAIKPNHIIGIIGVRDYNGAVFDNLPYISEVLEEHIRRNESPADFGVLTGGGRGVESLVVQWAESRGNSIRKIPPNINQFGPKKAFAIRYNNIVAECHDLIIFWDGYTDVTIEAIMSAMHMRKRASVYPLV